MREFNKTLQALIVWSGIAFCTACFFQACTGAIW